jgi:phage tail sheath protein FI
MGITNLSVMPATTAPVTGESHTFAGTPATIQLAHGNVQGSSIVVTSNPAGTTYVQGTDYSVDTRTGLVSRIAGGALGATAPVLASYSYYSGTPYTVVRDYVSDAVNGVLIQPAGSTIAAGATVVVSFSYADPSKVQDSDIIGAVSGSTYSGLQALLTTYNTMGFFAKLLLAPGYSQNGDVATALQSTAGTLRGMGLIDSPPNTPAATAIANRGVPGTPSIRVRHGRFCVIRRKPTSISAWYRPA